MEFINLHTSVLDSVEFLTASDAQRSTWLCLYRYCAGQENSGRIPNAKAWTERLWQQLCRVSARTVRQDSSLWSWDGDTLVIRFYNADKEADVRRLRSQAVNAAHSRWHRNRNAESVPEGIPQGKPEGTLDGIAEGKGKERKGKEYPLSPTGEAQPGKEPRAKPERRKKLGSVLPAEQPAEIGGRMLEVGALMGRRQSTPWTAAEFEAFKAQRLDTCSWEDFVAQVEDLRGYYGAKIPAEKDWRRRELGTLLNNWPGELDKARAFNREHNDGVTKV